ncbi:MAG: B12-binding domain-containing radical SAM protein [Nanoarchaeota archaeon]|nr:B12-binding domain-containing radical SAM protein [Nanoarchaeota archaeon]
MESLTKENIKIALVSFQKDAERVPPMGMVYIATYLSERAGIKNIKIIDKNFDNILEELQNFAPDIIGVGPMTIHYEEASAFAKHVKKQLNIPVMLGGVHISTLPDSFRSCFELAVLGEGEHTFADLISIYLKKREFLPKDLKKIRGILFMNQNKIIKTSPREEISLDTLPLPNFDFVNKAYFDEQEIPGANIVARRAFILTSRGCPYKCKFCSTSHFWGKLRLHSPEYTAQLIKNSIEKYRTSYIKILDDLFTINSDRLKKIKLELDNLNVMNKIKGIECQPRANLINDSLCLAMKDLKVKVVNFGFESGSERVLNWLKSGSVTIEMNKRAIVLCKKYGFTVYGSLIFGSPGEKLEDMRKTLKFIDFAIDNKADYIWSFISTPFPNTPFWEIAIQRGKVDGEMNFNLLTPHNLENPLLLDDDIDKEEFKRLFLLGRKKLRKLKIQMIFKFFKIHPLKIFALFARSESFHSANISLF